MVSKQTNHNMTIEHHPTKFKVTLFSWQKSLPGNLLTADKALVYISSWTPVEDAGGIILILYLVLVSTKPKVNIKL